MKQFISAAASVNIGKHRANNEDNLYFNGIFLTAETREKPVDFEIICGEKRQFYAVCDGMGGEQMGELASLITVETLHKYAELLKREPESKMDSQLERFITEANGLICGAQKSRGANRIGTTLAMLAIDDRMADLYNIGDSRIYLLRKGRWEQLSEDHTAVARSVKLGIITPEQAKTHPHRNHLTQYMGIDAAETVIEAHRNTIQMKNNDIFLLCSDGLTDMIDESEICVILSKAGSPAEAARQLVDAALSRNGKDNITVVVLSYRRSMW